MALSLCAPATFHQTNFVDLSPLIEPFLLTVNPIQIIPPTTQLQDNKDLQNIYTVRKETTCQPSNLNATPQLPIPLQSPSPSPPLPLMDVSITLFNNPHNSLLVNHNIPNNKDSDAAMENCQQLQCQQSHLSQQYLHGGAHPEILSPTTDVELENHSVTTNHQLISNENTASISQQLNDDFQQHSGDDYKTVITFVDSPPNSNSEESWSEEQQCKNSSRGPQIINIQTIYSNSNSCRKRRMDWDTLNIDEHTQHTLSSTASNEFIEKFSTTQHCNNLDREKYKREKLNGGGRAGVGWSEEIGFDLNADFNSNSYINNETFMAFSPVLTVLKQEPQTEQVKFNGDKVAFNSPVNCNSLDANKNDKLCHPEAATILTLDKPKTDLNDNNNHHHSNQHPYDCDSSTQDNGQLLLKPNVEDSRNHDILSSERHNSGSGSISHQLLTVIDTSKIEQPSILSPTVVSNPNTTAATISVNNKETIPLTTVNADDYRFQYILAAATSIATKNNEDTLTYLNQGQSYEIKLKKIGDLSFYRDKILKSVIKICFHERRLQFMEREQMQQWQIARPGDRIIDVDVPLSYGLCHVSQPLNTNCLNTVEIFWDPMKEVGVYIKVNCISTEFTPKKHGGEKGVPFRLQIETYIESISSSHFAAKNTNSTQVMQQPASPTALANSESPTHLSNLPHTTSNTQSTLVGAMKINSTAITTTTKLPIHAAACQIKVFKLKGADRKHKQDRERIQKRPQSEQDKFQPSYECTIMNDIPLDLLITTSPTPNSCFSPEYLKMWPNSPVHIPKYDSMLSSYTSSSPTSNSSPTNGFNCTPPTITANHSPPNMKLMDVNSINSQLMMTDNEDFDMNLMPESTPNHVTKWLNFHRLTAYVTTFAQFSGADIMRMSKEDLIQICGLADGIRMFNILRAKSIAPRLTIYVSLDGSSYHAIYLITNTTKELLQKLYKLPKFYECLTNSANSINGNGNVLLPVADINSTATQCNLWNTLHTKFSGSNSNIFNDSNCSSIYILGPSGVHVAITDEVLSNEMKDGSLYVLEIINGKVLMKLINKNII